MIELISMVLLAKFDRPLKKSLPDAFDLLETPLERHDPMRSKSNHRLLVPASLLLLC